ncbi:MAG TPA: hypothetical protein VLH12_12545 [Usitatibacter sp.]|nr:hypothetical protein [Usitatibacter sp.]
MSYLSFTYLIVPVFLAAMLVLMSIGHYVGTHRIHEDTESVRMGLVSVETAVFGVLGLILAFTYSGASTRFELRRTVAVQEANAVGTAWLRLDLLPQPAQADLKEKMRRYGRVHVAAYDALPDYKAFHAKLAQAKSMQSEIWVAAVAAVRDAPPPTAQLLLPALNDLIDMTGTREALAEVRTPGAIVTLLMLLTVACSFLAGYGLAGAKSTSRRLHMVGFAVVLAGVIYIVLDYDQPRVGLIRVDFADEALESAVSSMK